MKRLLTFLFVASCLTAAGQVTYPYNPDGNADGDIAVGDLQDFLSTYGGEFYPNEILVDSIPLSQYISILQDALVNQAMQIDSIQQLIDSSAIITYDAIIAALNDMQPNSQLMVDSVALIEVYMPTNQYYYERDAYREIIQALNDSISSGWQPMYAQPHLTRVSSGTEGWLWPIFKFSSE